MIINVYCPNPEKSFVLDVSGDLTLKDFKALCHVELLSISVASMKVLRDGQVLIDDQKRLDQLNVTENDILLIEKGPEIKKPKPRVPLIDFSSVQVPGSTSSTVSTSSVDAAADPESVQVVASRILNDPNALALLRERNPELASALLSNDMDKFGKGLLKIREARANFDMERIRMLNSDPMDPEVQKRIAEEIERQNIDENMNLAIENAPESFGQVVMLWINVRVNGFHVKAFVDSGAQMTIMSSECAERCNIMRLADKRWAGIAKGVGVQKILGRIHLAQIQIEDIFLNCSFSILEDQPMSVLLGLDMLRRHQCVIDLKSNSLVIGTTNTRTKFLGEAEIPAECRTNFTDAATNPIPSAASSNSNQTAQPKPKSETEDEKMDEVSSTSLLPSSSSARFNQSDLNRLLDMGFSHHEAKTELQECAGNVENAILSLLRKRAN